MKELQQATWRKQLGEAIAQEDVAGVQTLLSSEPNARAWITTDEIYQAAKGARPEILKAVVERCEPVLLTGVPKLYSTTASHTHP